MGSCGRTCKGSTATGCIHLEPMDQACRPIALARLRVETALAASVRVRAETVAVLRGTHMHLGVQRKGERRRACMCMCMACRRIAVAIPGTRTCARHIPEQRALDVSGRTETPCM